MVGLGVANALLSTTGSIVVANASAPDRRGEALSMYYVASSAGVATGPGGRLRAGRGGRHDRSTSRWSTALSVVVAVLVLALRTPPGKAAAPGRLRAPVESPRGRRLARADRSSPPAIPPCTPSCRCTPPPPASAPRAWFFPLMSGCTIACRFVLRRASDQFGRARVLVPALVALALGNVVLATSPTIALVIAAAALLGTGNSMLYPTLVALVVDRTPVSERGLAIGTLSGAWDVGVFIGAPLIALLVETRGYSAGFLASALTIVAGLRRVPRERARTARARRARRARRLNGSRVDSAGGPAALATARPAARLREPRLPTVLPPASSSRSSAPGCSRSPSRGWCSS